MARSSYSTPRVVVRVVVRELLVGFCVVFARSTPRGSALRGEGPDAVPLAGTNLFGLDRTFARARTEPARGAPPCGAVVGVGTPSGEMSTPEFKSLEDFWPFYALAHSKPSVCLKNALSST